MATRILAVLNQKGGVGKTTTCVNLGAALARRGFRVLLVDMDPQANLTVHLGLEPPRLQRTSYSLLLGQHRLAEAVHETGVPGLSVVPSTLALANAEIQLASTVGRELVLREALEEWLDPAANGNGLPFEQDADAQRPAADFVLIDCPPSLGTLTMNALCAAGEVLLPIQTEFFALQGVAGILESVRAVQRLNKGLRLSMVVPSLVDLRTTLARDVIDEVRTYFGDVVTKTVIRKNVKLAEAPSHGKTIFEWEPRCNGAQDYEALAAEVLGEPLPEDPLRKPLATESADVATVPDEAVSDEAVSDEAVSDEAVSDEGRSDEGRSDERMPDELAAERIGTDAVDAADDDDAIPTAEPLADAPAPRSSGISIAPAFASDATPASEVPRRDAPADPSETVTRDVAVAPADTATSVAANDAHRPPASRIDVPAPAQAPRTDDVPTSEAAAHPAPTTEAATLEAETTATEPVQTDPAATREQRSSWWSALRRGSLRG